MHLREPITPADNFSYTSLMQRLLILLVLPIFAPSLAGCRLDDPRPETAATRTPASSASLALSSTRLQDGKVPKEFTCDGGDQSPPLAWTAPPAGTKSFVLTVTDPDAPGGTFTHWVLYNLPANSNLLAANLPTQDQLADGTRQGRNDFAKVGYGGPCPPHGSTHRYFFDLFALDTNLDVSAGATRAQVEDAMNTHVLARGKLLARYSR
jgi:Raf kinase inhibitor-like YbhB/YbcL family protein